MSVPNQLKIQFYSVFVLFSLWLIFELLSQFSILLPDISDTLENNSNSSISTLHEFSFRDTSSKASNFLFRGFVLLLIAISINHFLVGNKVSGDTLSIIALFSAVSGAFSRLFDCKLSFICFNTVFILSIFAILITVIATPFH